MSDLRYPIGPFQWKGSYTPAERQAAIELIATTPKHLRAALAGLTEAQLATPYRDGGWTVRQVVHHLPDSHINAYVRFKLALTEDMPLVKTYQEAGWAETPEVFNTPVETSLVLLEKLHERWVNLLRSLKDEEFATPFQHPQHETPRTLDWLIAIYAWHGPHHVAHITALRERMGWN
jgi:hypothetical protein